MRRLISTGLVLLLTASGVPIGAQQEGVPLATRRTEPQQGAATVTGTVSRSDLKLLPNARVQLRNVGTGRLVASTLSGPAGEFSFTSVQPGSYIVEVLDSSYRMLGMTAPFTVTTGASLTASIVAVAPAAATGAGGGFSLLGLGPVTSMVVLGAAGAAGVTAVVATQPDASPSR